MGMADTWPIEAEVDGKRVSARPLQNEDLDVLVSYWHETPIEYLKSLGVDAGKLGSPAETRARLRASLDGASDRLCVVAEMEGELVAYSNLAVREEGTAYGHLHTLRDDAVVRRAVYHLFPQVTAMAFEYLGVTRLRFEASVDNLGINRYLQSFGLKPRRLLLEEPDGMARPGEFHVYELSLAPDDATMAGEAGL
jgi:RimJ/RimL family protein N-acetyltransferase